MNVVIRNLVGKNCITNEDGQRIYDLIKPELQSGSSVELDFDGVLVYASPFFNAAIGQMLQDMSTADLNRLLHFTHLSPVGEKLVRRVIENSRQYYSDPDMRKAIDDVIREQQEQI